MKSETPVSPSIKGHFDSFAGLIPCKAVATFTDEQTQARMITLVISKAKGGYAAGERIKTFARNFVQPVGATFCRTIATR